MVGLRNAVNKKLYSKYENRNKVIDIVDFNKQKTGKILETLNAKKSALNITNSSCTSKRR